MAARQMRFHPRLHLRRRLAERVAVGDIVRHSAAHVVEQHAELAVVFRIGHQQVDARPVQVRLGGRSAGRDPDAVHFEGREELHQAALEGGRHAGGVGLEQQAGEGASHLRGDRGLLGHHDVVAVAALGDGFGLEPPLGILEYEDADGLGAWSGPPGPPPGRARGGTPRSGRGSPGPRGSRRRSTLRRVPRHSGPSGRPPPARPAWRKEGTAASSTPLSGAMRGGGAAGRYFANSLRMDSNSRRRLGVVLGYAIFSPLSPSRTIRETINRALSLSSAGTMYQGA